MKFLKNVLIFFSLVISQTCYSQEYKQTIIKDFNNYYQLMESSEFEKSLQYFPPEVFEFATKEQLIEAMQQTYNNPAFEFEVKNQKIDNINDITKIENKFYVSFTFAHDMFMSINRKENEKDDEYISRIKLIKNSLDQSLGKQNVELLESEMLIKIASDNKVYAISNNGKSDWKFMVISNSSIEIAKKFLPKEITKTM